MTTWTSDQDKEAMRLRSLGFPHAYIGLSINRSAASVSGRLKRLDRGEVKPAQSGTERLLTPLRLAGVVVTGDRLLVVPDGLTALNMERVEELCDGFGFDWRHEDD